MKDRFILHRSIENVVPLSRLITVINGYPFYRSSGSNSGSPYTWFPFLCMEKFSGVFCKNSMRLHSLDHALFERYSDDSTRRALGLIERNLFTQIENQVDDSDDDSDTCSEPAPRDTLEGFPSDQFLSFNLSKQDELVLRRFVSFETLYISKCLGGGFWKEREDDLKVFFEYIDEMASQLLSKGFVQDSVNEISAFLSNMTEADLAQIKEVSLIRDGIKRVDINTVRKSMFVINCFLIKLGANTVSESYITPITSSAPHFLHQNLGSGNECSGNVSLGNVSLGNLSVFGKKVDDDNSDKDDSEDDMLPGQGRSKTEACGLW